MEDNNLVQARVTSETAMTNIKQHASHCLTHILLNTLHSETRSHHESTMRTQKTRAFEPAAQEQYRLPHTIELAANHTRTTENQDLGPALGASSARSYYKTRSTAQYKQQIDSSKNCRLI
jgi:predicted alpha/beta-fold hydrolase